MPPKGCVTLDIPPRQSLFQSLHQILPGNIMFESNETLENILLLGSIRVDLTSNFKLFEAHFRYF